MVVALFWATLFFGIIDLQVVPSKQVEFYDFYVLETSWGLLFTILVPLPLLSWAVQPQGWNGPQVAAVGACVLLVGLVGLALGQVFVGTLVASAVAIPGMWQPRWHWSFRPLTRPVLWPLDALVAVGLGMALLHGWETLDAARGGAADDITVGLKHLPMQAGFGLAVAASAGAAVLALANRLPGAWFAFFPAVISGTWFGVVARTYPDHVGSTGEARGTLTIVWSVGLLAVSTGTWLWLRRDSERAPLGPA